MIYPIGERARGAYSGAQWLLRLRSPEKDSGSGDQSVVESLREFSYMFPPNMMVSSLGNKRPGLSGRPYCKGVAIGVARKGACRSGERTLRISP